jgi:hypothetical protein
MVPAFLFALSYLLLLLLLLVVMYWALAETTLNFRGLALVVFIELV